MHDVVKTILTDPFAGRAGVFRFDPATGQRTRLGQAVTTEAPQTPDVVTETDAGREAQPENGEPAK